MKRLFLAFLVACVKQSSLPTIETVDINPSGVTIPIVEKVILPPEKPTIHWYFEVAWSKGSKTVSDPFTKNSFQEIQLLTPGVDDDVGTCTAYRDVTSYFEDANIICRSIEGIPYFVTTFAICMIDNEHSRDRLEIFAYQNLRLVISCEIQ